MIAVCVVDGGGRNSCSHFSGGGGSYTGTTDNGTDAGTDSVIDPLLLKHDTCER